MKPIYFVLFISVFHAVGIGLLIYGLISGRRSAVAASWPTAAGTVVRCSLQTKSDRAAHNQIDQALRTAKSIRVRYEPADPLTSNLSYGLHRSLQFTLAFAVTWLAFVVGFTVIWWVAAQPDNVLVRNLLLK